MKTHIPEKSEQQFSTTVKIRMVSGMQLTLSDCGELQGRTSMATSKQEDYRLAARFPGALAALVVILVSPTHDTQ